MHLGHAVLATERISTFATANGKLDETYLGLAGKALVGGWHLLSP